MNFWWNLQKISGRFSTKTPANISGRILWKKKLCNFWRDKNTLSSLNFWWKFYRNKIILENLLRIFWENYDFLNDLITFRNSRGWAPPLAQRLCWLQKSRFFDRVEWLEEIPEESLKKSLRFFLNKHVGESMNKQSNRWWNLWRN